MSSSENNGGGFSHGFLFGLLLGGGIVFLLGTKKGNKLLKTISEEGLEGLTDIEDFIEDEIEYEEVEPIAIPDIPTTKQKEEDIIEVEESLPHTVATAEKVQNSTTQEEHKPKRFFRRVVRKK